MHDASGDGNNSNDCCHTVGHINPFHSPTRSSLTITPQAGAVITSPLDTQGSRPWCEAKGKPKHLIIKKNVLMQHFKNQN